MDIIEENKIQKALTKDRSFPEKPLKESSRKVRGEQRRGEGIPFQPAGGKSE